MKNQTTPSGGVFSQLRRPSKKMHPFQASLAFLPCRGNAASQRETPRPTDPASEKCDAQFPNPARVRMANFRG